MGNWGMSKMGNWSIDSTQPAFTCPKLNNTVYHFVGFNLGVEILLKEREHQKKGALKKKIEASLYTLYWGFKKIPFELYTYVLTKILQHGGKFLQKLMVSKITRNLDNFRQAVESPKKLKFDGQLLSKKYIPSAKTYTDDLSNITLKYLCGNSPNSLCHF